MNEQKQKKQKQTHEYRGQTDGFQKGGKRGDELHG